MVVKYSDLHQWRIISPKLPTESVCWIKFSPSPSYKTYIVMKVIAAWYCNKYHYHAQHYDLGSRTF